MMRSLLFAFVITCALWGGSAAGAPVTLDPSSAWVLSYDDQGCRLARSYGVGDTAVTATFAKYAPGPEMAIFLAGKSLGAKGKSFRYRFLPSGEVQEAHNAFFGADSDRATRWQFGGRLVPRSQDATWEPGSPASLSQARSAELAQALLIDGFEVSAGVETPFALKTGKLEAPFSALDTCLDDLVTSWGYDPAALRSLTAFPVPIGRPGQWITYPDYPADAIRKNKGGIVRLRLDVSADGIPTKCVVQAAYSDPVFEKLSCAALMKRARFEPAKDASGAPVPFFYATSIAFSLPG